LIYDYLELFNSERSLQLFKEILSSWEKKEWTFFFNDLIGNNNLVLQIFLILENSPKI